MPEAAIPPAGDGWEPALAAALLGAERAPPAAPEALADLVAGADPGGTLLARLAVHATLHRAGAGLGPEALIPAAPRPRIGPECPPAAAARLRGFLAGGDGHESRVRLAEWCTLAAARGMRAPDWLLPALAARRGSLPDDIDGIAGPELAWLGRACGDAPEAAAALLARVPEEERPRRPLAVSTETLDLRAAMRRDFEPETGGEGALG